MARKYGPPQVIGQASPVWRRAVLLGLFAFCGFSWAGFPAAQTADGKAVYVEANCVGCHKWHGQGGGGYGGAALSLRETALERQDLIEVIRCGRPATGMPYHLRTAWKSAECYGMKAADIGSDMPPTAPKFLRDYEIEAVADYVTEALKGHGEPTKEECVAFWGEDARECTRF
jgi:mono/diheme cytochrome c family protein